MKTIEELDKIKKSTLKKIELKPGRNEYRILVGMATCGIAAGASEVYDAMAEELKRRKNVNNIKLIKTSCIGICMYEPVVEVIDLNGDKFTYVKMNSEKALRVIAEHVINGRVCADYTIDAVEDGQGGA